jgi:hypothetical protein
MQFCNAFFYQNICNFTKNYSLFLFLNQGYNRELEIVYHFVWTYRSK